MKRKIIATFSLLLLVKPLLADADVCSTRHEYKQLHMGTLFRLVFYVPDGIDAELAARTAFRRIEELENILSSHREDSELRRVSEAAFQSPQVLSSDLYSALDMSLRFARLTDGAFDLTVRPLMHLWRRAGSDGKFPDQLELSQVRRRVGYRHVLLNSRTRSLRFEVSGVEIDLGGVGKGYAADEALKVLRRHQIVSALVDAGGDIRLGLPPPGAGGWIVELAEGDGDTRKIRLQNCAIAGSGDAFQFVEIEGVRYSHIVDPRTGFGLRGRRSATVIAPEAVTADALATALTVLGPEKGLEIVRRLEGVSAQFVHYVSGEKHVARSQDFPSLH